MQTLDDHEALRSRSYMIVELGLLVYGRKSVCTHIYICKHVYAYYCMHSSSEPGVCMSIHIFNVCIFGRCLV